MAALNALMSSLIDLVSNLLPEVKVTFFAPSSSSSAQAPDASAVEADLRGLKRMLERIKATLYDAEERNIGDQSIRLWLKELRELGHEAEYIFEDYMYEVYRVQVEARNASEPNPIKEDLHGSGAYSVQIPHSMVDRIRNVKNMFEELAKHREALCLREEDAPRRKKRRHNPTSPLVMEQSIFGREEEKEKVIDLLLFQEEVFSVLPIVGKGGIGKTTIAQLVYNDKRVHNYFDLVGWVCVSNDFSIERIIQHIIESFTRTSCNLKSPSVLLEELATTVRGKRIFLVLDDVWNEEQSLWDSLRMPLIQATKTTILITTRNISVARIMQTMDHLSLEYLSDDKCWLLFSYFAFQGIDLANQAELVEIGKKIVMKCNGLPLAVKLIASLLSHDKELQSWMEILQSDLWELDVGYDILAPLQISYEHLPTYLKPCLLLCSMFPKDYEYSMNLMSKLWIAHGYIEPERRKTTEELAVVYTKMLYERSFFDDYNIKCDMYDRPCDATFRLHDMVHDLAWLNSEKSCCSVEQDKQHVFSKEVRHLYLRGQAELLCTVDISFMETLIMSYLHTFDEKQISFNGLSIAHHLRALDLKCAKDVLAFSLPNMKHVRYLSLGDCKFVSRISPKSIFSCYNLRILVLDIRGIYTKLEGIGNLINLEFLQLFAPSILKLPESLGLLKKLRVLEIQGDNERRHISEKNILPECIGNLVGLYKIMITNFYLQKLPESFCNLTNLKELNFQKCTLKKLPEDFGNLTSLQFFSLDYLHYFPLSCTKLIPNCTMNVYNLTTQLDNSHCAVGWLKEINDLKGALMIKGIRNIRSIADAKNANLFSKCNLEILSLIWDTEEYLDTAQRRAYTKSFPEAHKVEFEFSRANLAKKGILGISIGHSLKCKSLNIQDLDILENFKPHSNLKHLDIGSYCGLEFPRWMRDPLSCASLVKLWIRNCSHISSLPLGKVLSLKYLYIVNCDKLLHLKRESLPFLLKHLVIHKCDSLVEVALLEWLAELEISYCDMLVSLSTIHPKIPEMASESSEYANNYCHFKPSELKGFLSLKKMSIIRCPNLVIGSNQLVLAEDCEVKICCCYNLKDWCFQHKYDGDTNEIFNRRIWPLPRLMKICFEQQQMMASEQKLRQQTCAVRNSGQHCDQNTASTAHSSPRNLAALYQPPFALMFNGPFEKAKRVAALQGKWLLVNIQSTQEFSSHMLNRDTWANETLSQTIMCYFLFWQVHNTMSEGQMVCMSYKLVTLPAILVINPITGQKMRAWTGMVQPDHLLEDLLPYLDKGPKDHHTV
ncbi:hypothetical protein LUZ61_019223 [Rhynchospora tenuis]|uniref:UAS domain-containing protein n=1 Tax=Rhynchospora tenuis TaxID=198213 RepID=A0AAD5ZB07_9POAL|nr:hypothetical protein LUZ61_019223 [Rhynchospora tenuis]